MANDGLTLDEIRKIAADIGLTRFSDEHLQQLVRATNVALARRKALAFDELTPAAEPAHVFHLARGDRQ